MPQILNTPVSLSDSCNFIFFPPCFCRPAALNGEETSLKTCSGGWDCNGTHNAAVILDLQLVMGSVSIPWCTGTSWEGEGWREGAEAWAGSLPFPSLPPPFRWLHHHDFTFQPQTRFKNQSPFKTDCFLFFSINEKTNRNKMNFKQ